MASELFSLYLKMLVLYSPFFVLSCFIGLSRGYTLKERKRLAWKVALATLIASVLLYLFGKHIFTLFGITIDAFRIAGGAVLAHIAWSMLNGDGPTSHHGSETEKGGMADLAGTAFYPLTFPMIVGPGTIATLIIYAGHAGNMEAVAKVGAAVGAVLVILFLVLFFAAQIGRVLSETMRVITTRLMGMILLAIAVELIVAGLLAVLPGLR